MPEEMRASQSVNICIIYIFYFYKIIKHTIYFSFLLNQLMASLV